jgi:alcohol dehydrogenase YqhD (iron-dependent ADH family)
MCLLWQALAAQAIKTEMGPQLISSAIPLVGVAVDGDGNVIVTECDNNCIRKFTLKGHVFTLAGTGEEGQRDGNWTVAQFNQFDGIAVDGDGNVIVADKDNHRIRKITPQGQVSTLADTGEEGHQDGEGTVACFNTPMGVWMGTAT